MNWPSTMLRLWSFEVIPRHRRERPAPRGFRLLWIVEQRPVRREGHRHRVAVVLRAGDDFVEFPGHRFRWHHLILRHQVSIELQTGGRLVAVDENFPGLEVHQSSAGGKDPRHGVGERTCALLAHQAERVTGGRRVHRQGRLLEFRERGRRLGEAGLFQQCLLVLQICAVRR